MHETSYLKVKASENADMHETSYLQAASPEPQEVLTRMSESCPSSLCYALCHRVLMLQLTVRGHNDAAGGCHGDAASGNRHLQRILQQEGKAAAEKRR